MFTNTERHDMKEAEQTADYALSELDHRALGNLKEYLHALARQVAILEDEAERRESARARG